MKNQQNTRHLFIVGALTGILRRLLVPQSREGFMDGAMPLFVLGHSMGGHLALRLLARLSARSSKDASTSGGDNCRPHDNAAGFQIPTRPIDSANRTGVLLAGVRALSHQGE